MEVVFHLFMIFFNRWTIGIIILSIKKKKKNNWWLLIDMQIFAKNLNNHGKFFLFLEWNKIRHMKKNFALKICIF